MASMDREHPLGERRVEELYTIYVNNLPDELNEDGITQIFKTYGEICSLFRPPNAQWAYISYKTYREAEHAIRSLNERSPLYLKVAFRKKKVQPKCKNYIPDPVSEVPIEMIDRRYVQNGISHSSDYPKIVPGALAMNIAQMTNSHPVSDLNSVYPMDLDHTMYNPFESAGRYADTNAMWSRGCTNIDDYGRRYVSMGRGYTQYHIPEPTYQQYEQHIGRAYEKRHPGFYQYGEDRLQHDIGKCLFCGHTAKLHCAKCNAFYCSRDCQVGDWSRHMTECKVIPALVGDVGGGARLSCSSTDDQIHVLRKPRGIVELGPLHPLRRPRKVLNSIKTKSFTETSKDDVHQSPQPTKSPHREEKCKIPVEKENIVSPSPSVESIRPNMMKQGEIIKSQETEKVAVPEKISSPRSNERYDENANDQSMPRQDPVKVDDKNSRQIGSSDNEDKMRPKAPSKAGSAGSVDRVKADFHKMEKELAFQTDNRAQTNVTNQAPINGHVQISLNEQQEMIVSVPSTLTKAPIKYESVTISKDSLTKVQVIVPMPDKTFWVNRLDDVASFTKMMTELSEKGNTLPKVTDLVVGSTYAVQYASIWHRASILSNDPIEILYIDFGNAEPPQTNDFRSLENFTVYPAYALHLRLSPNSKAKDVSEGEDLSVKMIFIDDNGVIEVVDHDNVIETMTKSPTIARSVIVETPKIPEMPKLVENKSLPNVVDSLTVNSQAFVEIYMALDNNSYAVCVLNTDFAEQYQIIYETLTETCNVMQKSTNFSPKMGDFVCGKRDDAWLRGYVFSLGPPIRLALVDEARISSVEQVVPMSSEYKNVCAFGSIVTMDVAGASITENDTAAQFEVTEIVDLSGERIVKAVVLKADNSKGPSFTIKKWKPTQEQKGLSHADLKNNSEVCISAYSSERILYLRSLDTESLERAHRITQNVAKAAQTAPKLEGPPAIGQLVLAKFIDGNFYRAIVTKHDEGKIGVSYVDYGNFELTTIDQLRIMSDELKESKTCAIKVVLKDVEEGVPPTKEVHQYLDLLVGKEQSFICTFEGTPSIDGVTLTSATGECVNEKVNTYLTPNWKREDPSKNLRCFMMDDLEVADLGEVGHTVKALTLHATEPPFKYVMAPFDRAHITHITSIMPKSVLEYCESTKNHYIPRAHELCLAIYDGGWYRGTCVNPNKTPTQAVIYFVDFGNVETVNHVDIREMTKDFMSPGCLGLSCIVKNLGVPLINGKVPENIQRRLNELIQPNEIIDVKILKKACRDKNINGDYEIELPSVRETLIKEGLIQP